ncbi:glycosyltransferase family 2 protein [Salinisphaera orenii]|uniref:glycosyltransferase family 2 protein n=1 Tax=Salinisphaera orenii TaxID=856731 RepID=UPI000DBE529D
MPLKSALKNIEKRLKAFLLRTSARRRKRELHCTRRGSKPVNEGDLLLFSCLRNEASRLPFFLDYYRRLGVDYFFLIDNQSTDDLSGALGQANDITVFYASGKFSAANKGLHWINALLSKFGTGHWCLHCDLDEFLVYPHMDKVDLKAFTSFLESQNKNAFFAPLIDMYASDTLRPTYRPGDDPLSTCPMFDSTGYGFGYDSKRDALRVKGGVRGRVFWDGPLSTSPMLSKLPLVKWQPGYLYQTSHHLYPHFLNRAGVTDSCTGALLHFKFMADLDTKVADALTYRQHHNASEEYETYAQKLETDLSLAEPSVSEHYENWRSLERLGLLKSTTALADFGQSVTNAPR